jgi:hypothetical protein
VSFTGHAFASLVRRVAKELIPSHVEIRTSFDHDWLGEETVDCVEIRLIDESKEEPAFGVARVDGQVLRTAHAEDAIRHEMRGLAKKMGYA